MNPEIIPAVMPRSYSDLEEHLSRVVGSVRTIQIDVMDGKYVPARSWPYVGDDNRFDAIASESEGLPLWESVDYEIDLMVTEAAQDVERWIAAGAARIVVHLEHPQAQEIITMVSNFEGAPRGERTIEMGVAVGVQTDISRVNSVINEIDFVQCMGIERIGFQGEPYASMVLDQLRALRAQYSELILSVDGGVSVDTASDLLAAGANRLVVGSAIFESDNPRDVIRTLENL